MQRTRRHGFSLRLLVLTLLALLAMPGVARAHMGSTKFIDASADGSGARLTVHVETIDAAIAIGLGLRPAEDELLRHAALVKAWLARGLVVASDAGPCQPSADQDPSVVSKDGKRYVAVDLAYACPSATGVVLRDETVFDDDPGHQTVIAVAGTAQVLRAGHAGVALGAQSAAVPMWATARTFVLEGGIHLVTGYDHMLFLLSLILAAGLIAHRRGLRPALRDVAIVVTAFTLGHSVSLIGAALGWVSLPSQLVETAIAGSIVAVATINIVRPQAKVARPWLAGAFGVIHGFGFSSVLAEVGLPAAHRVIGLLAFNVGIELAQLAFVAIILLPLTLVCRHRRYQLVVMQGGSLAIAIFGCVWLAQRGLGL